MEAAGLAVAVVPILIKGPELMRQIRSEWDGKASDKRIREHLDEVTRVRRHVSLAAERLTYYYHLPPNLIRIVGKVTGYAKTLVSEINEMREGILRGRSIRIFVVLQNCGLGGKLDRLHRRMKMLDDCMACLDILCSIPELYKSSGDNYNGRRTLRRLIQSFRDNRLSRGSSNSIKRLTGEVDIESTKGLLALAKSVSQPFSSESIGTVYYSSEETRSRNSSAQNLSQPYKYRSGMGLHGVHGANVVDTEPRTTHAVHPVIVPQPVGAYKSTGRYYRDAQGYVREYGVADTDVFEGSFCQDPYRATEHRDGGVYKPEQAYVQPPPRPYIPTSPSAPGPTFALMPQIRTVRPGVPSPRQVPSAASRRVSSIRYTSRSRSRSKSRSRSRSRGRSRSRIRKSISPRRMYQDRKGRTYCDLEINVGSRSTSVSVEPRSRIASTVPPPVPETPSSMTQREPMRETSTMTLETRMPATPLTTTNRIIISGSRTEIVHKALPQHPLASIEYSRQCSESKRSQPQVGGTTIPTPSHQPNRQKATSLASASTSSEYKRGAPPRRKTPPMIIMQRSAPTTPPPPPSPAVASCSHVITITRPPISKRHRDSGYRSERSGSLHNCSPWSNDRSDSSGGGDRSSRSSCYNEQSSRRSEVISVSGSSNSTSNSRVPRPHASSVSSSIGKARGLESKMEASSGKDSGYSSYSTSTNRHFRSRARGKEPIRWD